MKTSTHQKIVLLGSPNYNAMEHVIVTNLSENEIKERDILSWPVWVKEVSRFHWEYEADEECLLLEGEVEVEADSEKITIGAGDFVTFRKGLKCIWTVKKPVRKHYNFPV